VAANDALGISQFTGYDGTFFPGITGGAPSAWAPVTIQALASENFANNGTTTTNAGSKLFLRLQPTGVWATSNSLQRFLDTSWTAGSTATSSPPQLNLFIGTAENGAAPALTPSGGVGNLSTGFGVTQLQYINTKNFIFGVVPSDPTTDNPTLTGSTWITFVGNRRSGVSGRRDTLAANDQIGGLLFNVQTANSATSIGSQAGSITAIALEASTPSARGMSLNFATVSSGTTVQSSRMNLTDRLNIYNSDNHTFNNATQTVTRLVLAAGQNTYSSDTHIFNNSARTETAMSIGTGTNTYKADNHVFQGYGSAGVTVVNFTTSTGVNFKGYTETVTNAAFTTTFTPNVSTATVWNMTLTNNITFSGFTNPVSGQSATFFFTQDATGSRLLTSTMKFAGGLKTLSTAGTSTDMISVFYNGTTYYATMVKGFA
jgi:hypothetical protein